GEAGLDQSPPGALRLLVRRVARAAARGTEDRDRGPESGQRAEALDELRLDAEYAPRVGVHPVARPPRVQQSLVGRALVDPVATDQDGALRLVPHHGGQPAMPASPLGAVSHARSTDSQRPTCSTGTNSSCLCASIGSPGPKFTAGMPSAEKRA